MELIILFVCCVLTVVCAVSLITMLTLYHVFAYISRDTLNRLLWFLPMKYRLHLWWRVNKLIPYCTVTMCFSVIVGAIVFFSHDMIIVSRYESTEWKQHRQKQKQRIELNIEKKEERQYI